VTGSVVCVGIPKVILAKGGMPVPVATGTLVTGTPDDAGTVPVVEPDLDTEPDDEEEGGGVLVDDDTGGACRL
jgi:hypothetical protein